MNKSFREKFNNSYLAKNINYLTKKRDLTKSELEKILSLGDGYISKYCKIGSGSIEPKIGICISLSNFFGVTLDELINQDLEEKEIEVYEEQLVLFCNKLLNDTKQLLCDWDELDFYGGEEGTFITFDHLEGDEIKGSNLLEEDTTFLSKFIYDRHSINELSAFTTMINGCSAQVIIMQYINNTDDKLDNFQSSNRYELYLVNSNGAVLKCLASHTKNSTYSHEIRFNRYFYDLLKDLYKLAYTYRQKLILDEYLK